MNDRQPDGRPDESTDGTRLPLDRRSYLRGLGGLAAAGAIGGTAPTATAETADQRIQDNRTTGLTVEVVDESGQTVEGADVHVEMQEHDFHFGAAVDANQLLDTNDADSDTYRQKIAELFNTAVLENHHKWAFWEDDPQTGDDATQWLKSQGLDVRGHACMWENTDAGAVPSDVERAARKEDAQTIRSRSMDHIQTIVEHYGNDVVEWDGVNEELHEHALHKGVYGDQVDEDEPWTGEVVPWTSELLADWYTQIQQFADQYGVGVAVNDFNTFAWAYTQDWYPQQIEHLQANGIDVDTIGFQGHITATTGEPFTNDNPDGRLTYDEINQVLSIYEGYGADLAITEFDTFQGDDWQGDQEKAAVLERYMKAIFGHPNGSAFLMWGFWDGNHWAPDYDGSDPDAPLFYEDWTPKPAYDVYTGLVFGEWWTDETGTTDTNGQFATTAYLGEHRVSASTGSLSGSATVELTSSSQAGTVTVVVDESDDGGTGGDPPQFDSLSAEGVSTNNSGNSKNDVDEVDFTWSFSGDATSVELEVYENGQTLAGSETAAPDAGPATVVLDSPVPTNGGNHAQVVARIVDDSGTGEQCVSELQYTTELVTKADGDFDCLTV